MPIIKGQGVVETDTHLIFPLREPFWSAWKKYEWENDEIGRQPGFGISVDIIRRAHAAKKKIIATYLKEQYEITPKIINEFYKFSVVRPVHNARAGVKLIVVPQSKFTRLGPAFDKEEYDKKELVRSKVNSEIQEELL